MRSAIVALVKHILPMEARAVLGIAPCSHESRSGSQQTVTKKKDVPFSGIPFVIAKGGRYAPASFVAYLSILTESSSFLGRVGQGVYNMSGILKAFTHGVFLTNISFMKNSEELSQHPTRLPLAILQKSVDRGEVSRLMEFGCENDLVFCPGNIWRLCGPNRL
jgi:hypothetical protein